MDREPVTIVSKPIYGPRFGVGMLALVALFSFVVGVASGGIMLPFLRSAAPVGIGSAVTAPTQGQTNQALLSVLPQTILAELDSVQGPVGTNLSIEQYLNDLEVRASQAGYISSRSFQSQQTGAEIGYVFKPGPSVKAGTKAMPETLVFKFQTGPQAGTLVLTEMRRDGVVLSAGMRFADLVRAGATLPSLSETQLLTPRGLIEIKTNEGAAAAYLDGVLIYPRDVQAKGQGQALLPDKATGDAKSEVGTVGSPQKLSIQAVWPAGGLLPEVAALVASEATPTPCSARVIVLDLRRATRVVLAERLQAGKLRPEVRARGLALAGFCPPASRKLVVASPEATPAPSVAFYDVRTGQVRWETAPAPSVTPEAEIDAWREPSVGRLASPLGQKGALASVACRAGGGYTIAVSGLPGPIKGTTGSVRVSSAGKSASLTMSWKTSANGYEVDGAADAVSSDPFLARLGAGKPLEFSSNGATITVSAPQPAQLNALIARCQKPKAD
ncbi:MAG: hypothetical protein ACK51R_15050 [Hyphomonadaceae bacterium]|uniref:hypothetical protein n=1 Tax=Aquidulcibacter sp. TaxID=2052990 RepID=UPI00263526EE|nr:hypothetical protein [Aquidulcibacter sp.]MCE2890446.1 hypothetical protein [Hyphomonadaceae bacterium]